MQAVIPALFPIGGGVGDVLPGLLPPDAVPLALHEQNELVPVSGVPHTLVNEIHQAEFPALTFGGDVVLGVGEGRHLFLLLRLEYRQAELLADRVVAHSEFGQLRFADVELPAVVQADTVNDKVGVDMCPVRVGADQDLPALEIFCKF